jgi:glutamine synthetase
MFKDIESALRFIKDQKVPMIDLKTADLIGRWRHMVYKTGYNDENIFHRGTGTSLTSYPGFKTMEAGDMTIKPDPTTGFMDPFAEVPTLCFICDIYNNDGTPFELDPRYCAKKAERYLAKSNLGGFSLWGPEIEFYLFDEVRYVNEMRESSYWVDSAEAYWNTGQPGSKGYSSPFTKGTQADPPRDHFCDLRSRMVQYLDAVGVPIKYHHHESGSAGQMEIESYFTPLVQTGDNIFKLKYIIKNAAVKFGKTATFMPMPITDESTNGMHYHQYITDGNKSLFYDAKGYGGLNRNGLAYIGGILSHVQSVLCLTNASTNSYRRLGGYRAAPNYIFFALGNRTAAVRIPAYAINERESRIEFRMPDATGNPYLSLVAMLMGGLDGIEKSIDPTKEGFGPFEENFNLAEVANKYKLPRAPNSLEEALVALEKDHDFLTKDSVMPEELIKTWIKAKEMLEIVPLNKRTHPYEYQLYYDL